MRSNRSDLIVLVLCNDANSPKGVSALREKTPPLHATIILFGWPNNVKTLPPRLRLMLRSLVIVMFPEVEWHERTIPIPYFSWSDSGCYCLRIDCDGLTFARSDLQRFLTSYWKLFSLLKVLTWRLASAFQKFYLSTFKYRAWVFDVSSKSKATGRSIFQNPSLNWFFILLYGYET